MDTDKILKIKSIVVDGDDSHDAFTFEEIEELVLELKEVLAEHSHT